MGRQLVFYSFVEDEATRAVVLRLFDYLQRVSGVDMSLSQGHPVITHGYGKLKEKALRLWNASKSGIDCFFLTDLDNHPTPNQLGKSWFGIECLGQLPAHYIFRISIREIESWIMADVETFSRHLGVAAANFPDEMDSIPDPKLFLFNLIRSKCRRKRFLEMIPQPGQHVGISYNPVLCDYIARLWRPESAARHSSSLARTLAKVPDKLKLIVQAD